MSAGRAGGLAVRASHLHSAGGSGDRVCEARRKVDGADDPDQARVLVDPVQDGAGRRRAGAARGKIVITIGA